MHDEEINIAPSPLIPDPNSSLPDSRSHKLESLWLPLKRQLDLGCHLEVWGSGGGKLDTGDAGKRWRGLDYPTRGEGIA